MNAKILKIFKNIIILYQKYYAKLPVGNITNISWLYHKIKELLLIRFLNVYAVLKCYPQLLRKLLQNFMFLV